MFVLFCFVLRFRLALGFVFFFLFLRVGVTASKLTELPYCEATISLMCWWLRSILSFPTREIFHKKCPFLYWYQLVHWVTIAEPSVHVSPLFVDSSVLLPGHSPGGTASRVLMKGALKPKAGPPLRFLMSARIAITDFEFCNLYCTNWYQGLALLSNGEWMSVYLNQVGPKYVSFTQV